MSMISEQIKHLRSLQEAMRLDKKLGRVKCDESFVENRIKIIDDAIDTIETLSTKVRANNLHHGWISCDERLPEESLNSVIGWDEYRERCCFVQYYNGRWVLGNDIDSVKIIAWQPVPEPYIE